VQVEHRKALHVRMPDRRTRGAHQSLDPQAEQAPRQRKQAVKHVRQGEVWRDHFVGDAEALFTQPLGPERYVPWLQRFGFRGTATARQLQLWCDVST
jgi:hypothetical protein